MSLCFLVHFSPTWQDYELFVEAVEQNTLQQFLKLAWAGFFPAPRENLPPHMKTIQDLEILHSRWITS